MNFKLVASAFALGLVAITGCSASSADETASTDSDIVAAPVKVQGAWRVKSSSSGASFVGIVFKADGTFFADVFTGVYCITAPCPNTARLEGTYTVFGRTLLLTAKDKAESGGYYDRYTVTRTGDSLRIQRLGTESLGTELELEDSYCAEPVDCMGQPIIHPMCVGHWTCSVQSTCGFSCGIEPEKSEIWPNDRTQLVAENKGGGFTPPPPPGSECAVGASKYTLDLTSRTVTWEVCKLVDWSTPLHKVSGVRRVTVAELAQIDAAMNEVSISKHDYCGADKPWLDLQVTSASKGTVEYADSFYACMGGERTFVDNIDSVFGAFRDIVGE
jgi:hypothetical protein